MSQQKMDHLKCTDISIRFMWEHERTAMMKSDGILTEFLARTTLVILLIIRGALLAARQMLYVFITKQTSIKAYYYDFTSLYTFSNKPVLSWTD